MIPVLTQMQQDAKLLKPMARRVAEYEALLADEAANLHLLEKSLPPIQKLVAALSEGDGKLKLQEWVSGQDARIRTLKDEFRYRFGSDLKSALGTHGLALEGQFPLLRVGCYTIRADFDTGRARISWGTEVETIRSRIPLSAEEIAKAVATFDAQLKKREFQARSFTALLRTAWERARQSPGRAPAERVLLTEAMTEMALLTQPRAFAVNPVRENFRDYSRIQFGFDLYRLKHAPEEDRGGSRLRLFVATFDSTTAKAKSLWVPDSETGSGTWYSYLSFEEQPA